MNKKISYIIASIFILTAGAGYVYYQSRIYSLQLENYKKEEITDTRRNTSAKLRGATPEEIDDKKFAPLREIISDTSNPDLERAITAQYMADMFMLKTDRRYSFLRDHLFVGEPFASFNDTSIPDEGRRGMVGLMRLYRLSLELNHDLPVSNYRLAEWEANRALEGKDIAKHTVEAQKYLLAGDKAFKNTFADTSGKTRLPTVIPGIRWLKGAVLTRLLEIKKDDARAKEARQLFEDSISDLAKIQPETEESGVQLLWAKFEYAIFLHKQFSNAEAEKIKALLKDIAGYPDLADPMTQPGFFRYIARLGKIRPTFFDINGDKKAIISLAKYSQEFSGMLKSLGWEL